MSDAEGLGAQDRIPREAIEAMCDELDVPNARDVAAAEKLVRESGSLPEREDETR